MALTAPVVSFVIITLNRKAELLNTLAKILGHHSVPIEIIVIDNNSTDGTEGALREKFGDILYRKLPKNTGIAAWNAGFKMARGEFIVIIDDDAYPVFDMKQAVEEFRNDKTLGLIAANIINYQTGNSEFSQEYVSAVRKDTHYFIGCGAIVRKDVLEKAGYYDERFFLYYNDNDLAARIIKLGFNIRFYSELKFIHIGSQVTSRRGNRFYFQFRNLMWYLIKNFPFFYLTRRLWREIRMNYKVARANKDRGLYLKAIFDTVIALPYLLKNRRPFTKEELRFVLGKNG